MSNREETTNGEKNADVWHRGLLEIFDGRIMEFEYRPGTKISYITALLNREYSLLDKYGRVGTWRICQISGDGHAVSLSEKKEIPFLSDPSLKNDPDSDPGVSKYSVRLFATIELAAG